MDPFDFTSPRAVQAAIGRALDARDVDLSLRLLDLLYAVQDWTAALETCTCDTAPDETCNAFTAADRCWTLYNTATAAAAA